MVSGAISDKEIGGSVAVEKEHKAKDKYQKAKDKTQSKRIVSDF